MTRADELNPTYTPTWLIARDGALVKVAARGYTKGQRKTWLRLEPTSAPAYVLTVSNDTLLNVATATPSSPRQEARP